MKEGRRRIFFDMDGTLAVWNYAKRYEDLLKRGYFLNLQPMENMVQAVRMVVHDVEHYEPFILSAVLEESFFALDEKKEWLDKHIPEIAPSHRIFTKCGADKSSSVPYGIRHNDILIDDFSRNLHLWSQRATAIKVLNGLNGTIGTWKSKGGNVVHSTWAPERIKAFIDKSE